MSFAFRSDALFLIAGPCVLESDALNLRVGEHLIDSVHRSRGRPGLFEAFEQALAVEAADRLFDQAVESLPVLHALQVRRKARIGQKRLEADRARKPAPEAVVGSRNEHPLAVAAAVDAVRRERGMRGAERARHLAGQQVRLRVVVEKADGGFE